MKPAKRISVNGEINAAAHICLDALVAFITYVEGAASRSVTHAQYDRVKETLNTFLSVTETQHELEREELKRSGANEYTEKETTCRACFGPCGECDR